MEIEAGNGIKGTRDYEPRGQVIRLMRNWLLVIAPQSAEESPVTAPQDDIEQISSTLGLPGEPKAAHKISPRCDSANTSDAGQQYQNEPTNEARFLM